MENEKEDQRPKGGMSAKSESIGAIYRESAGSLCTYVIPLTLVMAYSLFCETTYHDFDRYGITKAQH